MEKRKGFYAELSLGKRKVIYLQPYFYQDEKWRKLGGQKNVRNKVRVGK